LSVIDLLQVAGFIVQNTHAVDDVAAGTNPIKQYNWSETALRDIDKVYEFVAKIRKQFNLFSLLG